MITKQLNTRVPELTISQINKIVKKTGMTKTQILIMAIDRLSNDLLPDKKDS